MELMSVNACGTELERPQAWGTNLVGQVPLLADFMAPGLEVCPVLGVASEQQALVTSW